MPVYKRKIEKDFTVVHNAFVRDKALGINARGILITMLSMPEYNSKGEPWNFTIRGLAETLPDGKAKIQSALNELEKHGYLMPEYSWTFCKLHSRQYVWLIYC